MERFEDLICWQKARAMTNVVYDLTRLPCWKRRQARRLPYNSEVRSQLYVAADQCYITPAQFESATAMSLETSKTIGGLIGYLQNRSQHYLVRESDSIGYSILDLPPEFCNSGAPALEHLDT